MRLPHAIVVLACVVCPAQASLRPTLTLASGGRSRYVIVLARDASPGTQRGATELQHFLRQMTGARLPIVSDSGRAHAYEIVLGDGPRLRALGVPLNRAKLGTEGYVLRTVGPRLVIAGGEPRGTMYGIYGLLEDHLGCRWYTRTVSRIPRRGSLRIPPLDETVVPAFEYRYPDVYECNNPDWSARNRMNGSRQLTGAYGGAVSFGRGLGVHTFERLLPPSRWFAAHPEWFMMDASGKRRPDQLCCTNEDTIRALTDELLRRMRTDPAQVFSVSQNDNDSYCACPRCAALAKREGSQAGPLLYLVNKVAATVAREFPDRSVETLAYAFTRKPPRTMRPLPNVIVRLCSFECCFSHPLETCDSGRNRLFVEDLRAWHRICDRLWVWDYETSFAHYLLPFPNYGVWQPNIRFYAKSGVRGLYLQDNNAFAVGELNELGGWLQAKLLWNPKTDARRATDEFLAAVYGRAASPLRRYLDLLTDKVARDNIHVTIWETPDAQYLTDDVLARADRLWDEAETAVAGDPDAFARVCLARISPDYAIVERLRYAGLLATHDVDHAHFTVLGPKPAFVARIARLRDGLLQAGVRSMGEGRVPLPAYLDSLDALTDAPMPQVMTPLPSVSQGAVELGLACAYFEGEWRKLPDFGRLAPAKTTGVRSIDLTPRERLEAFGLRFAGFIKAPRDGIYAFTLRSNDGSRLWIGDRLVTDNDGTHLMRARTGCVALKAGLHPIRVDYFQANRAMGLEVLVEGPGLRRQPLPASMLWRASR